MARKKVRSEPKSELAPEQNNTTFLEPCSPRRERERPRQEKSEFWKNYDHPLWQKKRLEILERAGFSCEFCGDRDSTLQVHHGVYHKDKKPWEYENHLIHSLCDSCHERAGKTIRLLKDLVGMFDIHTNERIYGYAMGMLMTNYPSVKVECGDLSDTHLIGIADCFETTFFTVHSAIQDGCITGRTLSNALAGRRLVRKTTSAPLEQDWCVIA